MKLHRSIFSLPITAMLLASPTHDEIRKIDFQKHLDSIYPGCSGADERHVGIAKIDYWDVNEDGAEEAVIVASTCATGTAGPDVHSVFKIETNGELSELPFAPETSASIETLSKSLNGNRNYWFRFSENMLAEEWWDSTDREKPLTRYFKWNGKMFVLLKVKVGSGAP